MLNTLQKRQILEQTIIDYFGYFGYNGQHRLLQDLKRTNSQYLCIEIVGGKKEQSVSKIGVPSVDRLKKNIKKHKLQIDQNIQWKKTSGKYQVYEQTVMAFKKILELCEIIYNDTQNILPIEILLGQLKGNKSSIIRSIALTRYQSKTPGKRLVGKQTKFSNNSNVGFVEEHLLPTTVFINYFITQIENGTLKESNIDKILQNYFIVNLNTDDDYLLSQNGYKSNMPCDYDPLTDDPFIRYTQAGINIKNIMPISKDIKRVNQ